MDHLDYATRKGLPKRRQCIHVPTHPSTTNNPSRCHANQKFRRVPFGVKIRRNGAKRGWWPERVRGIIDVPPVGGTGARRRRWCPGVPAGAADRYSGNFSLQFGYILFLLRARGEIIRLIVDISVWATTQIGPDGVGGWFDRLINWKGCVALQKVHPGEKISPMKRTVSIVFRNWEDIRDFNNFN